MQPPAQDGTVLELTDVDVRYGRTVAIQGLSFRSPAGAVGLLGPNGAGKSSLIKALLGLVRPSRGKLRVFDLDVERNALEVRRRVGYMPESAVVFPGMTGFENVAYAGRISGMPSGESRRRAHEVLEYVGQGEERYRPADGYSQGMRQRLKLACALVHDPELLLLDEPTNGLDPRGRTEILELIHDLGHAKGINVVLSSHLLDDVESVCDSVVVLARGQLCAEGRIAELKERNSGARVRLTFDGGAQVFLDAARAHGFEATLPDPLVTNDCEVRLPPGAEPRALLELALRSGASVRRFVPRKASLEEIFLETLDPATEMR